MQGLRHKGRAFALQLLYQMEIQASWEEEIPEAFWKNVDSSPKMKAFVSQLVLAVAADRPQIDQWLEGVMENWKLTRVSVVARNLLRLATAEMLLIKETPFQVVLDEAVTLAKEFTDEDSTKFINSVLEKCWKAHGEEKPG